MHVVTFALSMVIALSTFALVATAIWGASWFMLAYVAIALVVLQAGYLAVAWVLVGRRRDQRARSDPGAPEPKREMRATHPLRGPASGEGL